MHLHHTAFRCLAAFAIIQQWSNSQVTVPSAAAAREPNSENVEILSPGLSHSQAIYSTSDIANPAFVINSLLLRRSARNATPNPGVAALLQITISVSTNSYNAMSNNFGRNHGPGSLMVFSGTANFPPAVNGPWPRPWSIAIPFATPFPYSRTSGSSLVVEIVKLASVPASSWILEFEQRDVGSRTTELPSCRFASGGLSTALTSVTPTLGGLFEVTYQGYPSATPSFASSIHVFGVRGSGQSYLGRTLPINLAQLGIPSTDPPACSLATDILFIAPLVYTPSPVPPSNGTLRQPALPIPNNISLGGSIFITQPIGLDTNQAMNVEVHGGWANRWTIGTNSAAIGSYLIRLNDNGAPTGTLFVGDVPTMGLQ